MTIYIYDIYGCIFAQPTGVLEKISPLVFMDSMKWFSLAALILGTSRAFTNGTSPLPDWPYEEIGMEMDWVYINELNRPLKKNKPAPKTQE